MKHKVTANNKDKESSVCIEATYPKSLRGIEAKLTHILGTGWM
jgi:hypothetical protein